MEIKKLIKKGATLKDTGIVIVLSVFFFMGIFAFISQTAVENDVEIPASINYTQTLLQTQQTQIQTTTNDMRDTISNLTEAGPGEFLFYGIRGFLAILKMPLTFIDAGVQSVLAITNLTPIIPTEV